MAKFIATENLVKTVCACTSQAQIETVIKPQRWLDCQQWFVNEPRTTPSGAMYKGDVTYSDGKAIPVAKNKALVLECLEKSGEGYSTAIINSAKSCIKSFKDWGWTQSQWLDCLKFEWNGTGRQGSPRIHGFSVESEMLWTYDERAAQKFAKLLRQIKSFKGEAIPAFEKICYTAPAPVAPAQTAPQPTPVAQPASASVAPVQVDWRVEAIKAAIKAGLSDDGLGKLVKSLFN